MTEDLLGRARGLATEAGLELREDAVGLVLAGDGMELRAGFGPMAPRLRPDRLSRELLVRAARVKGVARPRAVDATAGLGEDSLLLAAAGFEVDLCERDPVICSLLADAVRRARTSPEPALVRAAARMRVVPGDAAELLGAIARRGDSVRGPERAQVGGAGAPIGGEARGGEERGSAAGAGVSPASADSGAFSAVAPDVVYLDPMFPGRRKSAAVKKKFQLLHRLERPCGDEEGAALLAAAEAVRPRKVVVKRPVKAEPLAGRAPAYSLAGKAVRFDVYVSA